MSINMSHVAAAASASRTPASHIPMPKKFTSTLKIDNDATDGHNGQGYRPFGNRGGGASSVAAKAQLFNNISNATTPPSSTTNGAVFLKRPSAHFNGNTSTPSPSSATNGAAFLRRPSGDVNGSTSKSSPGTTTPSSSSATNGAVFLKRPSAHLNGSTSPSSHATAAPATTTPVTRSWKQDDHGPTRNGGPKSTDPHVKEVADLRRQLHQVQRDHEETRKVLREREENLAQLRSVSERVYKEYDVLKNKYEVETGAMHQAMQRASEWYKQNRELKRRSTALLQRVAEAAPDGAFLQLLADQTDSTAADVEDDDELDALRNTVKQLSAEVARLQSELNAARLDEFEAQEAAISAAADLEAAKQADGSSHPRLSGDASGDERLEAALRETEDLRFQLEEERRRHADETAELRAQLEEAQRRIDELSTLTTKSALATMVGAPPPPPPPLPPPPPPLPPPSMSGKTPSKDLGSAVQDMADLLGLQKRPVQQVPEAIPGGAIDDIINEIKGGRFTLKATEKQKEKKKEESTPAAVSEMLNILGTLKRRTKVRASIQPLNPSEQVSSEATP